MVGGTLPIRGNRKQAVPSVLRNAEAVQLSRLLGEAVRFDLLQIWSVYGIYPPALKNSIATGYVSLVIPHHVPHRVQASRRRSSQATVSAGKGARRAGVEGGENRLPVREEHDPSKEGGMHSFCYGPILNARHAKETAERQRCRAQLILCTGYIIRREAAPTHPNRSV